MQNIGAHIAYVLQNKGLNGKSVVKNYLTTAWNFRTTEIENKESNEKSVV